MALRGGALEDLVTTMQQQFWRERRVFITGHSGFKGGWLALWLARLGARVHGYALAPPTTPSLYRAARVGERLAGEHIADLRDRAALAAAFDAAAPEVVFHLAAQPLVRAAYRDPVETYAVNLMGTVDLLETVRQHPGVRAVVVVTSDKCYENHDWVWPYREDDALGGHDPYSSSKACAELVSASYRRAFLEEAGTALATARAGNVIGGGDWAAERLVPDVLRAIDAGEPVVLRAPGAIRPWQHVLEPLAGYLDLAERLCADEGEYIGAWNFGPEAADARPVRWLVEWLCAAVPGAQWRLDDSPQPREAAVLRLDSSKARAALGWRPRWPLEQALARTLDWHRAWRAGEDMQVRTLAQIADYMATEPPR